MKSYSIHKLEKTNFDILKPLMLDCFGMNVAYNYFKWKFLDNPSGEVEGYYAVCAENNEVAAYYGVIPELYEIEDQKVIIYQSCDTMTHSSHRRQGLFQKLANHCYDELRKANKLFIIGFSGEMSTPGFLKFGWNHVCDMRYYFIPGILPVFKKSNRDIKTITDYKQIEDLIRHSNDFPPNHSHKSVEIYQWRISNPLYIYKTIAYHDGDSFQSYATYYEDKAKLVLFDFCFGSLRHFRFLVRELKRIMRQSKLKGIVAYVQENSRFSRELKKAGFISNPFSKGPLNERGPFIIYSSEANMTKYSSGSSWLLNSFDHDAM